MGYWCIGHWIWIYNDIFILTYYYIKEGRMVGLIMAIIERCSTILWTSGWFGVLL